MATKKTKVEKKPAADEKPKSTVEQIQELQRKRKRRDLSEADDDRLMELYDLRRAEIEDAIPRPTCCESAFLYPAIVFSVNVQDPPEEQRGRWYAHTGERGPGERVALQMGLDYWANRPEPIACPYCRKKLPKMVPLKSPPSPLCRVVDGGYYCDTCKERLSSCYCYPAEAGYGPEGDEGLAERILEAVKAANKATEDLKSGPMRERVDEVARALREATESLNETLDEAEKAMTNWLGAGTGRVVLIEGNEAYRKPPTYFVYQDGALFIETGKPGDKERHQTPLLRAPRLHRVLAAGKLHELWKATGGPPM
jgi:hypothetical protein